MSESDEITAELKAWTAGDAGALERLTPLIYPELRRIAERLFWRENEGHTLQPTALVHEAFAVLGVSQVDWQDRTHFFAACARIIRNLLTDHARAKEAQKRGGGLSLITLSEELAEGPGVNYQVLDLDRALSELFEIDSGKAEMLEMQIFAGLELGEISHVTGRSVSSVQRDIKFAKAWLASRISENTAP